MRGVRAGGLPRRASDPEGTPLLSQQWSRGRLRRLYEPPPRRRLRLESQRHRLRRLTVCRLSVWSSPRQPSLLVVLYPSCMERGTAQGTFTPLFTRPGLPQRAKSYQLYPHIAFPSHRPEVRQSSARLCEQKTPWLRHHGALGYGMKTFLLLLSAHRRIFLIALLLFFGHARWIRAGGWSCWSGRRPDRP